MPPQTPPFPPPIRTYQPWTVATGRDGRAQCATLHVDEANTPARRLYAAAGFVEGGRREDYYAVGRHAIFMERALDS